MVPPCSDRISRVPPYSRINAHLHIRGCHPLWPDFPDRSAYLASTTGLLRFRSPLLAESRLMSVPPGTEMFQFPGFASSTYGFSERYPIGVGCPIRTSTDQSLLAAPRGFSQRATSFFASWCQGIHRMPFSRSRSRPRIESEGSPCTETILRRQSPVSSRQLSETTAASHQRPCPRTILHRIISLSTQQTPLNTLPRSREDPPARKPSREQTTSGQTCDRGAPRDAPEPDSP